MRIEELSVGLWLDLSSLEAVQELPADGEKQTVSDLLRCDRWVPSVSCPPEGGPLVCIKTKSGLFVKLTGEEAHTLLSHFEDTGNY